MKVCIIFMLGLLISGNVISQSLLDKAIKTVSGAGSAPKSSTHLSNDEVIRGLKEALNVGTSGATSSASAVGGFMKNPLIKIPFPPEAKQVESKARQFGMSKEIDKFVLTMNRAAEDASKEAAPILLNAIKSMSITDGLSILKGGDNAATTFLRSKTTAELTEKFTPLVKNSINKVELTKYWKPIISKYNKLPGVKKQNPDLDKYVTSKALEGLFSLLAQEEAKIRKDPAAQVTDLLKKVFGGK
jgi:hypothetical protein